MEACLAESLEIVQGLDRKRDFKSEFKANLKELKSTRKFKKNKKEQLEKLKGKSLVSEFGEISRFFLSMNRCRLVLDDVWIPGP